MHRYLISYMDLPNGQIGAIEVTLALPIRNGDDVDFVAREVRATKASSTVQVTGFSRFEETR